MPTATAVRDLIRLFIPNDIETRLTTPDPSQISPRESRADRVRRLAVSHYSVAGVGHDAKPWLDLAEDLGELMEGDLTPEDEQEVLDVVAEHLTAALGRIRYVSLTCDMSDHVAVGRYISALYGRAADLRFVDALVGAGMPDLAGGETMTSVEVAEHLGLPTHITTVAARDAEATMRRRGVKPLPYRVDGQAVYPTAEVRATTATTH